MTIHTIFYTIRVNINKKQIIVYISNKCLSRLYIYYHISSKPCTAHHKYWLFNFINWLVVSTRWKILKSVGIIIPNIWKVLKFMFQTTNQIEMLHHLGASPFCLGYYYEIFQYVPESEFQALFILLSSSSTGSYPHPRWNPPEIPGCAPWDFHKQCSWCHSLPLGWKNKKDGSKLVLHWVKLG